MTSTPVDINAYANIMAYRDIADHDFQCDWVTAEHYGDHDWCPSVLEQGDPYALVVRINPASNPEPFEVIGRYCIGCGYYLFGTPEPAPLTPIF